MATSHPLTATAATARVTAGGGATAESAGVARGVRDGEKKCQGSQPSKVCVRDKKCYCNCDCRTHVTEHGLEYMADGHNCELTEPYPLSRCQAQHTQKPNNSSLRFNVDGFRSG